jgi:RNA polymerase sigma-70 factor (ECF subfamily)
VAVTDEQDELSERTDQDAGVEHFVEARRRFDEVCAGLRPDLHRFCTRMVGNPWEGEDVLHDALVHAFYRYAELRDAGSLRSWLFRIAHNKCIDFLRARRNFDPLSDGAEAEEEPALEDALDRRRRAERVVARIAAELPPRERAAVVLKDVLDLSLEETAEITGVTVGAVKAALHRGREKLEHIEHERDSDHHALTPSRRALVDRYLAAFNARDWDAVLALVSDDARLEVVHVAEGPLRDACYFDNYARLTWRWKLELSCVDGVEAIVHYREVDGAWIPRSIVELKVSGGRIALVRDYTHVGYMLRDSVVEPPKDPRHRRR